MILGIFIGAPWLALLPAVGFFVLYRRSHRAMPLVAAIAWVLYTVYEYGMYLRYLCTGECNIRVDLLLITPALWILSIWAVVQLLRRPRGAA